MSAATFCLSQTNQFLFKPTICVEQDMKVALNKSFKYKLPQTKY